MGGNKKRSRKKKKLDQWRERRRDYRLKKSFEQLGIKVEENELTSGTASELARGSLSSQFKQVVEPELVQLGMDDEIQFSCYRAGKCCFGSDIVLTPYDVWEMMKNSSLRAWGYWSTTSLYIKYNKQGILDWFLNDQSGLPVAHLLHVPLLPHKQDSIARCRLAIPVMKTSGMQDYVRMMNEIQSNGKPAHERYWRDDRGMPMFHCVIQDHRPTVCQSYPIGRVLSGNFEQIKDSDSWCYMWDKRQCATCFVESFNAPKRTVRQYLEDEGLMARYEQINLWNDLCCWMLESVPSVRLRYVAGGLMYDFDSILLKGGAKTTELSSLRPKTFKDLVDRVRLIVENSMKTFGCEPKDTELVQVVSQVGGGW